MYYNNDVSTRALSPYQVTLQAMLEQHNLFVLQHNKYTLVEVTMQNLHKLRVKF